MFDNMLSSFRFHRGFFSRQHKLSKLEKTQVFITVYFETNHLILGWKSENMHANHWNLGHIPLSQKILDQTRFDLCMYRLIDLGEYDLNSATVSVQKIFLSLYKLRSRYECPSSKLNGQQPCSVFFSYCLNRFCGILNIFLPFRPLFVLVKDTKHFSFVWLRNWSTPIEISMNIVHHTYWAEVFTVIAIICIIGSCFNVCGIIFWNICCINYSVQLWLNFSLWCHPPTRWNNLLYSKRCHNLFNLNLWYQLIEYVIHKKGKNIYHLSENVIYFKEICDITVKTSLIYCWYIYTQQNF